MSFIDSFRSKADVLEETSSFIRCTCPVCNDSSLKMNTTQGSNYYGAYRCWTNNCSNSEIRNRLGLIRDNQNDPFRPSLVFSSPKIIKPIDEDTINYPDSFEGKTFLKLSDYKPAKKTIIKSGKVVQTKTVYTYSPYLRVLRLDKVGEKKKVYIQNWDVDRGWLSGTGDRVWPCYGQMSVLESCNNWLEADSVFFVEGEKCCEFLRRRGYAAFTFMAGGFHGEPLKNALTIFRYFFPHIKNILYVCDSDTAGVLKEKYIRSGVANKLGYSSIYLPDILGKDLEGTGFDLADMNKEQLQIFSKEVKRHVNG